MRAIVLLAASRLRVLCTAGPRIRPSVLIAEFEGGVVWEESDSRGGRERRHWSPALSAALDALRVRRAPGGQRRQRSCVKTLSLSSPLRTSPPPRSTSPKKSASARAIKFRLCSPHLSATIDVDDEDKMKPQRADASRTPSPYRPISAGSLLTPTASTSLNGCSDAMMGEAPPPAIDDDKLERHERRRKGSHF